MFYSQLGQCSVKVYEYDNHIERTHCRRLSGSGNQLLKSREDRS